VAPGFINTDIVKTVPPDLLKEHVKYIPAGRFGEPEEVASTIAFLSCDDSSFVNGTCILCCGGAVTVF
jgi:NAD(P)-dependent dehydrogenase (short-subunit alcohol dehydrogenase family)